MLLLLVYLLSSFYVELTWHTVRAQSTTGYWCAGNLYHLTGHWISRPL